VRHARHSIRTKSNDLKDVLNKIESGLHNIHAQVLIYVKDAMETYLIWMSSPFFIEKCKIHTISFIVPVAGNRSYFFLNIHSKKTYISHLYLILH